MKPIHRIVTHSGVVLLMVFFGSVARGESPAAAPGVRRASFDRESRPGSQQVRFGRRAARVGDEIRQTVSLEMRLNTSLRQGNDLIEKNQTVVRSNQQRRVTSETVDQDRVTAVQVRYLEANKEVVANGSSEGQGPTTLPVEGKTYHCRRAAEDAELIVVDSKGQAPPPEECEIVTQSMDMVGRTNPLAQFLAGREVSVGDTIELPKELAAHMFNLGNRFGEVARFDLILEKVETLEGARCACFLAQVEAASNDSSQMRMEIEGPLVVQIDTCRAVRLDLTGPIGMSETRGSYSTVYQLLGTGQLKVRIDSSYRDSAQ